ncbi:MAG: hypothetical protein WA139_04740 [Candidatus Aenigmatarchaeota archaeon]
MDWKVIAALVVAVAIVVSGFLASGGVNLTGTAAAPAQNPPAGANPVGDFLSGAKDAVSNLLTGTVSEKNINRTLQVSGSLFMNDDVFRMNTQASSVVLNFNAPASMDIGNERINFSDETKISIGNFTGKLDIYSNATAIFDGSAETIDVSNIGILPHTQKTAQIKIAAPVQAIKIYNAGASLNLNATGSINVGQGKVVLKVTDESVRIENYKGNFDISGANINLEGLSTKVLLEKISIG